MTPARLLFSFNTLLDKYTNHNELNIVSCNSKDEFQAMKVQQIKGSSNQLTPGKTLESAHVNNLPLFHYYHFYANFSIKRWASKERRYQINARPNF